MDAEGSSVGIKSVGIKSNKVGPYHEMINVYETYSERAEFIKTVSVRKYDICVSFNSTY